MDVLRRAVLRGTKALGVFAAVALTACTTQTPNNAAVCNAFQTGASHVEVVAAGTITRVLGIQPGVTSPHEGFLMRLNSSCNLIVRVEVNTDFTGSIPLQNGEGVSVKGEYEYYGLGGVIHWTHRNLRGNHPGGYIVAGGRVYE